MTRVLFMLAVVGSGWSNVPLEEDRSFWLPELTGGDGEDEVSVLFF